MSAATLRAGVGRLSGAAARDVRRVLSRATSPSDAAQVLGDLLPALVREYGAASSTLAAQWYVDERGRLGVRGSFSPTPVNLGASGADALAGYGAAAVARHGAVVPAVESLVIGGLQRRIANYARETVMRSSIADPAARGWERVGEGKCDLCALILGRGAVYTEATADFLTHDNCGCTAQPAWT